MAGENKNNLKPNVLTFGEFCTGFFFLACAAGSGIYAFLVAQDLFTNGSGKEVTQIGDDLMRLAGGLSVTKYSIAFFAHKMQANDGEQRREITLDDVHFG